MILYALSCDGQHRFESWFASAAAFDDQAAAGLVSCPLCGSQRVAKAIMAPAVLGASRIEVAPPESATIPDDVSAQAAPVALLDERQSEIRALVRAFRDKVLAEAQDVGARFPDEARRMHEGEIPMRQIHGQATLQEARDLIEDGITILPMPRLPDELN